MSFKVPVNVLNQKEFVQAMRRLTKARLPFKYSYQVKTLATKLDEAQSSIPKLYEAIVKKYVELDDKGEIVPKTLEEDVKGPDGKVIQKAGETIPNSFVPKSEEDAKKMNEEVEKFINEGITIDCRPLHIEALEKASFSAEDLEFLDHVLFIPDHIKNNVVIK